MASFVELVLSVSCRECLERRFFSHVQKTDGCWLWKGARTADGYGLFGLPRGKQKGSRTVQAHRLAYFLATGEDPEGFFALHGCDNPGCVRVDQEHVHLGTQLENVAEARARGRIVRLRGAEHWTRKKPERAARGSRNGAAKLTWPIVREIRALAAAGASTTELAVKFNVTRGCIRAVRDGATWREGVMHGVA